MNTKLKKLAGTAMLAGLLFAGASAQAIDLRSWDQKINDATRRFVVLPAFNNEVVLDKETQLVWQRTPSGYTSWVNANAYCDRISIGGRYGWRLPTISELMSLMVAQSGGVGRLPAGHPFLGLNSSKYWSSSTYPTAINMAAVLDTMIPSGSPYTTATFDVSGIRAWCVRGPSASQSSNRL